MARTKCVRALLLLLLAAIAAGCGAGGGAVPVPDDQKLPPPGDPSVATGAPDIGAPPKPKAPPPLNR